MNKHVMVDIETMGNKSDAAIVSIGACQFDLVSGDIVKRFYRRVNLESAMEYGTVDASTVLWWMKQEDAARDELQNLGSDLPAVLTDFSRWFPKGAAIWSKGPSFDLVIIKGAYLAYDLKVPWEYYNELCVRTIERFSTVTPSINSSTGVKHNALDDATCQAKVVSKGFKQLVLKDTKDKPEDSFKQGEL